MSWIDQCKIAFKTQAQAIFWQRRSDKSKSEFEHKFDIVRKLSIESGIPINQLWLWWGENAIAFDGKNNTIWCPKCGVRLVMFHPETKKLYSHGLCRTCAYGKRSKKK